MEIDFLQRPSRRSTLLPQFRQSSELREMLKTTVALVLFLAIFFVGNVLAQPASSESKAPPAVTASSLGAATGSFIGAVAANIVRFSRATVASAQGVFTSQTQSPSAQVKAPAAREPAVSLRTLESVTLPSQRVAFVTPQGT